MGVRVGRGDRGRRPREGNDKHVDDMNGQGNDQCLGANEGVEGVNGNVERVNGVGNQGNVVNQNGNVVNENVRNVLVNGNQICCSYKEFLAYNPKEYDGKGGDVVLTRWIEKIKNVQDMSGCSVDQKMKYTAGSFVGKALTFHEVARLVSHLVTPESRMIERGNMGEPSKDKNGMDDNKRTRTGIAFATTINPVGGENMGIKPSELGIRYEIKIASGHLVEIDKIIKNCKIEIEGHVFDIDLIPFGHGSFDVIV
nr:reverse transcriptase domain-containing protein [Tanacetum cinerariifolium]